MMEVECYVCSHVFADVRPVLLVAREDGDWMFMCGDEHPADENYHLVGMNHLLERDSSLKAVLTLGKNAQAERTDEHSPWRRSASV